MDLTFQVHNDKNFTNVSLQITWSVKNMRVYSYTNFSQHSSNNKVEDAIKEAKTKEEKK